MVNDMHQIRNMQRSPSHSKAPVMPVITLERWRISWHLRHNSDHTLYASQYIKKGCADATELLPLTWEGCDFAFLDVV
eukprot:s261_g6.t1